MLRFTGAISAALTLLIAGVLTSHTSSTDLVGTVWSFDSGTLDFWVQDRPESPRPKSWEYHTYANAWSSDNNGISTILFDGFEGSPKDFPVGAEIQVSHREIYLSGRLCEILGRGPFILLEANRIRAGGRTCSWETSTPAFYLQIAAACLAPLVPWGIAGLIALFFRKPAPIPGREPT
jgi:hypothetical protein